jgi:growth factor receptor-binding protein 2
MEARSLHDFKATAEDELSFSKNAILKIVSLEEDANWYRAELNGREGYIPCNYIQLLPNPWYVGRLSRKQSEELLLERDARGLVQPDGAFLVRQCESTPGDFSLSVKFGDGVQHFKVLRDNAGKYFLWVVKFDSLNQLIDYHRTATVSRTHNILLKDMADSSNHPNRAKDRRLRVIAKYDFQPNEPEELAFRKGDVITVLEQDDENWWKGELRGASGLFPVNYVEQLNK